MGLFDLFKGGEKKNAKEAKSPAAKWADRIEKRAQNYDRQEAITALADMAAEVMAATEVLPVVDVPGPWGVTSVERRRASMSARARNVPGISGCWRWRR